MVQTILRGLPLLALSALSAAAQVPALTRAQDSLFVRQNYRKLDRQGVRLYTIIYVPQDADKTHPYPIIMERTP